MIISRVRLSTGVSVRALGLLLVAAAPLSAVAQQSAPSAAQAAPTGLAAWSIKSDDMAADPSVRFGVLPNGMRYALKHNATPKGTAAIRFAFDVGKVNEDAKAQGVAHYLEHMAFNGSKNIPEGKLVPMLERLGLAFGADTNASTGFDVTTYQLDLPKTDAATVDAGLLMMHEVAANLLIEKAAVDRERGIIQSEARVRNDAGRRKAASLLDTVVPGTSLGEGLAITPEIIGGTAAADIRTFYDAYYRPENATLVIVGDFDVDQMEGKIRSQFSGWQGRGKPLSPAIPLYKGQTTRSIGLFADPAVPESIDLLRATTYAPPANNMAEQRDDLLRTVASIAMGNRLQVLSRDPKSPIIGGGVSGSDIARTARLFGISIVAKDGQWQPAAALAEQEMRRAAQYGFTSAEIEDATKRLAATFTNRAQQAAGATSPSLANELASDSVNNELPTSPAQDLATFARIAPSLTPDAVNAAFREAWGAGPTGVHVATKSAIAGGQQQVATVLSDSAKVAVTAPVVQQTKAFAYDSFGPAGKVVSDHVAAATGVREVKFANGVELNIKKTDFEPGKILFRAEVGSGVQSFPVDRGGLSIMVGPMSSVGGLKAHDADELNRIVAGRQVNAGMAPTPGAIVLQGATNAKDLDFQMKLVAAQVSASGFRPEAQAQWQAMAPILTKQIQGDAIQTLVTSFPALLGSGDARLGLPDPDQLKNRSLDELKATLQPQLESGRVTIAIVGDVDEQAAIDDVARTLAALPQRASAEAPVKAAPVQFAKAGSVLTVRHGGNADQGALAVAWKTTDDKNFKGALTRELLASVMQLRLLDTLREKLGATYTPNSLSIASNTFDGFGAMVVFVPAQPSTFGEVDKVIRSIAADLTAKPVSADEILRARKPMLENYQKELRQNSSWLAPTANAQSKPDRLLRFRTREAELASITAANIQTEAKKWFAAQPVEIKSLPADKK